MMDVSRAAGYLARVNMEIVKAAAARRQGRGFGQGERPAPSLASPPVRLVEIGGDRPASERVTPLGRKTAIRRLPHVLASLPAADPRRRAAMMLADTMERVGSVRGQDLAGADSKGVISDGGATTRVKHAARLRIIEALANGWPVDRRHGRVTRGPARVLMRVQRANGKRQEIQAFPALLAVCVFGLELSDLLARHGWSVQNYNLGPLSSGRRQVLDDVAEALGIGRSESDGIIAAS